MSSQIDRTSLLDIVLKSFSLEGSEVPNRSNVEFLVNQFLVAFPHLEQDKSWIVGQVLQILVTGIDQAQELVDPNDYHEWLEGHDKSAWRSWPWLKLYLKERLYRPSAVIDELERSTDRVLELIGDPKREGLWDRRGMVVGHVQSGKTQHYTAVVAKALDAGYKVVIILSGIHENLRQQTQERIEECITGKNSRDQFQPFGIRIFSEKHTSSAITPQPLPDITSLTSVAGDYGAAVNSIVDVALGEVPAVFVIKKNVSILKNVLKKIRGAYAPHSPLLCPILVIDDEADHSSVNTAKIDADTDPTRINQLIRKILWSCDKVAFVGYTATPYANIFMDDHWVPKSDHRDLDEPGSDLFPRAFIIGLEAPTNYIGPDIVFGHDGDESLGIAPRAPLPMHENIKDADGWLQPKHKSNFIVTADLPKSLTDALRAFVLSMAARVAIGQDSSHCSMLIHVTRFNAVQAQIMVQVQAYITYLRSELDSGHARESAWNDFGKLWDELYVSRFPAFRGHASQQIDPPKLPDWTEVEQNIIPALQRLQFSMVNSQTKEDLDFSGNQKDGLAVIAVGGDRLSRGLTLEGLTTSYFLRGARAFDTLMQMGRWFGYRPGYAHLCRIYAPATIVANFKTIVLATEELRREFSRMSYLRKTPSEYGLRVREPRADLLVTALNKMRRGETVRIHFGDSLISSLDISESVIEKNFQAFKTLIASIGEECGPPTPSGANHKWEMVDWETISTFFSNYTANSNPCLSNDAGKSLIQTYVESVHKYGDLAQWTVVVIGSSKGRKFLSGAPFLTVTRKRQMNSDTKDHPQHVGRVSFQGVALGSDESLDLTDPEISAAKAVASRYKSLSAAFRDARPSGRGLLLIYPIIPSTQAWEDKDPIIGIAVSLPSSKYDSGCDYVCTPQKMREIFGTLFDDMLRDEDEDKASAFV